MADPVSIANDSVAARRAALLESSPDRIAPDVLPMTVLHAWDVVDEESRT